MEIENEQLTEELIRANTDRQEMRMALRDYEIKKQELDVLGNKVIEQDEQISVLRLELREARQELERIGSQTEKRLNDYELTIAAL